MHLPSLLPSRARGRRRSFRRPFCASFAGHASAAQRALVFAVACVSVVGCGRSSLEVEPVDYLDAAAPPGVPPVSPPFECGASSCPTGCCDGRGLCQVGANARACGTSGARCADCVATGFSACDARRVCARDVARCGPTECPSGCCRDSGGVPACVAGTDASACGAGGERCVDCSAQGTSCEAASRSCRSAMCNASNCNGCCVGDACVPGTENETCGSAGQACASCGALGQTCRTAPRGGGLCEGRPACGPATCEGCCTAVGTCSLGFTGVACGSGGAACRDCAGDGSTCNTLSLPRVCANQESQCPAKYTSCPAAVTTSVSPSRQGVCDAASDLDSLQAACGAGHDAGTCAAAFRVLVATHPACATCLEPFHKPFAQLGGLYRCAAPFVDRSCNHTTGCATDCQDASCGSCPLGTENLCRSQVNGGGGQCNRIIAQAACVLPALRPGGLCSPATYGANYGSWLRTVGEYFCGAGRP